MLIAACCRQLRLARIAPRAVPAFAPASIDKACDVYRNLHTRGMVATAEVEKVAAKPAWPITVENISPNLVTAQYAG